MAEAFQQAMGGVKERYVERLRERIALLSRLQAQLTHGPLNAADAEALREQAHQLAGNGLIFGFEDISNAGRALDGLLIANAEQAAIGKALAALIHACSEAVLAGDISN